MGEHPCGSIHPPNRPRAIFSSHFRADDLFSLGVVGLPGHSYLESGQILQRWWCYDVRVKSLTIYPSNSIQLAYISQVPVATLVLPTLRRRTNVEHMSCRARLFGSCVPHHRRDRRVTLH